MGGKKQQTTTSTSETKPWQPMATELQSLWQQGNQALGAMPTGPNATQLEAMDWLKGVAPQLGQGASDLRNLGIAQARGDFLDPASNPFITGAVEAAQRPLRDQLDQNILQIGDAAQLAGAYGGDRERLLRGQALGDFNQSALDIATQTYAQNYANERQLQQNAGNLIGIADALSMAPGQLLGALGDQEYSWALEMPWAGLDRMAALLQLGQGYGTSKGTQTGPAQSTGGGIFSGALGGASAGSAFGPWGAGIGAVLGGIGGLF